ncbi:MAG TPA: deoxyribodipyrimidine photo-lyase [Parvibaculum sp.]|uniref:cryptochrome/photolyase family protein n=1 Tax=Parvibaculum sp. TaxID=2024848 RepID=UPI002B5F6235|nr:deoxyribodipyrimidine photo-lyase [Parvibaculum sp.]HMM14516.1 deoxyribodipyrimidine photo-lyase [Parvibaculum sp.]
MSAIVWFRQDLRLADNPALVAAAQRGEVLPVFILDPDMAIGGASRWWLHGSLEALGRDLARLGAPLVLRRGRPLDVLNALVDETGARAVFWNRCYEPEIIARDSQVKSALAARGIETRSFNGALLIEPWEMKTGAGEPYKVFTPFWRALSARAPFDAPAPAPTSLRGAHTVASDDLVAWQLRPSRPDWAAGLRASWQPGEASAQTRLVAFLECLAARYDDQRDFPAIEATSCLSPHLHWGEISPRRIWASSAAFAHAEPSASAGVGSFLRELGWREFCAHLLFHWPEIASRAWKPAFDAFPWRGDRQGFDAWARGRTGYPIVDAGMRELWRTGFMHNRVRMIVASFLVKDLMIDWREGAGWFEDTLVDADLASNRANWQWVAGSGADASPFFRIFNPVTQGEKFDAEGAYVRRHVPELAGLDRRFIHRPWEAPKAVLDEAGIVLGKTYPLPMVDHAAARTRALAAYEALKRCRDQRVAR